MSVKDQLRRLREISQSIIAIERAVSGVSSALGVIGVSGTTPISLSGLRGQLSILETQRNLLYQSIDQSAASHVVKESRSLIRGD